MIVVVEGISAAGKTTFASRYAPAVVDELKACLPRTDNIAALGQYWSDLHSKRWLHGLEMERTHDVVYFDTDPLKVHYAWCLWQIGENRRDEWIATVQATREHIKRRQLGFADRIVFIEPSDEQVRQQKANDYTRRRRNFDSHLRLREPLRRWYELLETLAPGRVVFNAHQRPQSMPDRLRVNRYDLQLFDELIDAADGLNTTGMALASHL